MHARVALITARRGETMTTTKIQIATPDGFCTTELVIPAGGGPWPAVIVFFDAGGFRPAQTHIAERIAASGYAVLQPDLFHRSPPLSKLLGGPVTLEAVVKVFQDPDLRSKFMAGYYLPALDYANLTKTVGAVIDYITTRSDIKGRVGTTGYCMGGNVSVRVATIFGDRIAATAAFHPGGLVTDQPDSPHLRVKAIKSRVYLAPAMGDLPPEAEAKLRAELDSAHVRNEIEQYDAKHGYAVDDAGSDVYDVAAAERHYAALDRLYRETLHA
jgi:carboxymethylenebutenolidase